jgi:hypothetical protein
MSSFGVAKISAKTTGQLAVLTRGPNAQDQLPGGLDGPYALGHRHAGPVNCIRLFGLENLRCPLFCLPFLSFFARRRHLLFTAKNVLPYPLHT